MTKDSPNKTNSRRLRTLLGISLGIHLLFFSAGFLIVADVTVTPVPMPPMEVSLLPPVPSPMAVEKRLTKPKVPAEEKPLPREAKQEIAREEPILKTVSEPERPLHVQAAVTPAQAIHPHPLPVQRDDEASLPSPPEAVSTPTPSAKQEPLRMAMAYPVSRESTSIVFPAAPPTALPAAPPSASFPERSASLPAPPPSDERIILARPRYGENPKPVYPAEARKKGYQGEVLLRAEVLSNGRVGDVELKKSSGHEILDRSALAAVKQWKFIPAREGEKTVAVWVTIPVKFQLQ
jgi:protein TonB